MDTNLHDPRGKIRCLQQAENERVQKAERLITKFSEYVKNKGLKSIDKHKRLLKQLETNDEKEEKEK